MCQASNRVSTSRRLPGRFREITSVQSFAHEGLDDRLAAYVQAMGGLVQLVQHFSAEVHVDPLNRRHHPTGVGEELGDVFTSVHSTRDLISAHCTSLLGRRPTSSLHRASSLPGLLSIASPNEGIRRPHPPALRRSPSTVCRLPSDCPELLRGIGPPFQLARFFPEGLRFFETRPLASDSTAVARSFPHQTGTAPHGITDILLQQGLLIDEAVCDSLDRHEAAGAPRIG